MNKTAKIGALAAVALLTLTACSGGSATDRARSACIDDAKGSVNADSFNTDQVEASDFGGLLYEGGLTDSKDLDDKNATVTVTGEVTYTADGREHRKEMLCIVKFTDGEMGDVEAFLT